MKMLRTLLTMALVVVISGCSTEEDRVIMETRTWFIQGRSYVNGGIRIDTLRPVVGGALRYDPESRSKSDPDRWSADALHFWDSVTSRLDWTVLPDSIARINGWKVRILSRRTSGSGAAAVQRTHVAFCRNVGCNYLLLQEGVGIITIWPWHTDTQRLTSIVRIYESRSDTMAVLLSEEDLDYGQYEPLPPVLPDTGL